MTKLLLNVEMAATAQVRGTQAGRTENPVLLPHVTFDPLLSNISVSKESKAGTCHHPDAMKGTAIPK